MNTGTAHRAGRIHSKLGHVLKELHTFDRADLAAFPSSWRRKASRE
jgi:hypothetical protein